MRNAALFLLFAGLAGACGSPAGYRSPSGAAGARTRSEVRALEQTESEVLRDLATIDRRIAQRARIEPLDDDMRRVAMTALFADDPSLAVVDGRIDPFSFDARARGLASAREKVAQLPRELPKSASGTTPAPALERMLLVRLVDEEALRLEEERGLPRSASALVRAIVETWPPVTGEVDLAERDRWIARRLEEVRTALDAHALDTVRARDLDDALDALEHLVDAPGFAGAMAELVRVRDALESSGARHASTAEPEWTELARRLRAHAGIVVTPAELERSLDAVEKDLRSRAEAARDAARIAHDVLVERLAEVDFAPGPCVDAVVGSRLRSMAAPAERAPSCHLRHLVASAADEESRAIALAAMHDHVVVARWALDVARGTALATSSKRHPLFALANPETQARLERIALARPVTAIVAGETARLLVSTGEPAATATRWNALGDVPLDVAGQEIARR